MHRSRFTVRVEGMVGVGVVVGDGLASLLGLRYWYDFG